MKYKFLALTAIAALVAIPASSIAQNVPAEGSTIKGNLVIGRSTFALPPGEWKVVAVGSADTTSTGSRSDIAETASVRLVQLAANGTFIASIWTQAPLTSARAPGRWIDSTCDRKDLLHRDDFNVNPFFPECLVINHIVLFLANAPANAFERRAWDWFEKNSVKRPATVLSAFYRKYFSGDYVGVNVAVNPEFFGQEPSLKTAWTESEWHPLVIKNDPKRLAFVESFKKWSYVMAENAKSTLMDRKPKSALLPAFDELRVGSSKVRSITPTDGSSTSAELRLSELKALLDKGLITKEEFDEKRAAILKGL